VVFAQFALAEIFFDPDSKFTQWKFLHQTKFTLFLQMIVATGYNILFTIDRVLQLLL